MPRKRSQSMRDHFWAKPLLTILDPKLAILGVLCGGLLDGMPPPPPSAARYGVLRVRLGRSEG